MGNWVRAAAVLEARRDDGWVLFHPDSGLFCDLDPVGAEIWEMLAEPLATSAVVERLIRSFAVDRETCTRDVTDFVATLAEKGFVTEQD